MDRLKFARAFTFARLERRGRESLAAVRRGLWQVQGEWLKKHMIRVLDLHECIDPMAGGNRDTR